MVFDQEPVQQKLSSASSVNSIVSHVAKTIEQDEVGRVAGWAVRFEKLLHDSVGIKVFTVSLSELMCQWHYIGSRVGVTPPGHQLWL